MTMELMAGPFLSYASMRFKYCVDQRAAGETAGFHRLVHLLQYWLPRLRRSPFFEPASERREAGSRGSESSRHYRALGRIGPNFRSAHIFYLVVFVGIAGKADLSTVRQFRSAGIVSEPEGADFNVSERIYKLQPNRTLQLRGFDDLGAAAALHSATADGFTVSGIFRDPADFCVLMLHDADNFYEHPSIRYLPDTNFSGLTLTFDAHYSGLHTLDSPRYATIDWPYLDVIRDNGTTARIPLFAHAQKVGGTYTPATGSFTVVDNGLKEYDRLTLWYLNYAFDYIVPKVECSYAFTPGGAGTVHFITVAGTTYSYTELAGDADYTIAQRLADAAGLSAYVTAVRTFGQVDLRAKKGDGAAFLVAASSSATQYTLYGVGAGTVAAALAAQINSVNWNAQGVTLAIGAAAAGPSLTVTAAPPGEDGNTITMYAVAKSSRLTTAQPTAVFSGGSSDATWRVSLDFTALGIPAIRQMWLTFAPPVACGRAFADTEWSAVFSNWTLSGPEDVKKLQVAGPGSVRVDEKSQACTYSGSWTDEAGFYSKGYARRCSGTGDQVTVTYECAYVHDLYLGTSLYGDRGTVGVRLDGDAQTTLDCRLSNEPAVVTRRRLRGAVAAGKHTVVLRSTGGFFYFDFLEAAVVSDVPDERPARTNISPALDYSTDHTYKLSPARLMWIFDKLGMNGPMNEYIGVFWWNQRVRAGATIPSAKVVFSGTYAAGDQVMLSIGGKAVGKTVFPSESNATIASHFAYFINSTYVGVWAAASGNELTITAHSPTAAYAFPLSVSLESVSGSTGRAAVSGTLEGGIAGKWVVDPSQSPALNRGAQDWHADFYQECAARGREVVTAASMELVNPPAGFTAQFANGSEVTTSVGFGNLHSSHCAFNSKMLAYQKLVYSSIAALMANAGLTPRVQFGEFCWWYFPSGGSMAFYDAETSAAAAGVLGRPLHVFGGPNDDPEVNGGADAMFLRNRLRDHVSALASYLRGLYPNAKLEVLFPYDVNYPSVVGVNSLGGRLLHAVNFPVEWSGPGTSGFDTLKMEALDFGSATRSLTLARETMKFPLDRGWPQSAVRYLAPVFNGGCPWTQEYRLAKDLGIPVINLWAFDHVCIFGLELSEPRRLSRSVKFC